VLQGCHKGVTRALQGCCRGVTEVLHLPFPLEKKELRLFHKGLECHMLQKCYKGVIEV
jgi:hypothetical protein